AQSEDQLAAVFVGRPAFGQLGDDRFEAVLRHVLVEQHEVVNTPIAGMPAAIVDSSWIDMLAGLAKSGMWRMPPDFWAKLGAAPRQAAATATDKTLRSRFICASLPVAGRCPKGCLCGLRCASVGGCLRWPVKGWCGPPKTGERGMKAVLCREWGPPSVLRFEEV